MSATAFDSYILEPYCRNQSSCQDATECVTLQDPDKHSSMADPGHHHGSLKTEVEKLHKEAEHEHNVKEKYY
jgi:hypothetical protein